MNLPTYNGWPNYPTWNVALWMDNDEGSYSYARDLTRRAIVDNGEWSDRDETTVIDRAGAAYDLANALEEWHGEMTPDLEGFVADLHGWAVRFVDWRHIAEHLVDEYEA